MAIMYQAFYSVCYKSQTNNPVYFPVITYGLLNYSLAFDVH